MSNFVYVCVKEGPKELVPRRGLVGELKTTTDADSDRSWSAEPTRNCTRPHPQ